MLNTQPTRLDRETLKAMANQGCTYTEIAALHGLSRERVRQLANKYNVVGAKSLAAAAMRRAAAAEAREARKAAKESALMEMAERVRNGESCYKASGRNQAVQRKLIAYCRRIGVASVHPSRNPFRKGYTTALAQAGLSFCEGQLTVNDRAKFAKFAETIFARKESDR